MLGECIKCEMHHRLMTLIDSYANEYLIQQNQGGNRDNMARINKSDKNAKVNQLLSGMEKSVAESFTFKQRKALRKSMTTQDWRIHNVDFRPTLALPFLPWSFYVVFLAGVNRRELLPAERFIAFTMFLLAIFVFGLIFMGCVFVLIYLLKSWLGIDLFPNESLGIWDKVKNYF